MRYTPAREASLSEPVLRTTPCQCDIWRVGVFPTVYHDCACQRWQRRQSPQHATDVRDVVGKCGAYDLRHESDYGLWCRHKSCFALRESITGDDQGIELSQSVIVLPKQRWWIWLTFVIPALVIDCAMTKIATHQYFGSEMASLICADFHR